MFMTHSEDAEDNEIRMENKVRVSVRICRVVAYHVIQIKSFSIQKEEEYR